MYYLELIQRFWGFNKRRPIGSTAVSMYLFLLKTGYDKDRYDFQISDVIVSKELGLTRRTIKLTKVKLSDLGLIRFQTKNGFPCNYRLVLDYPLQISEPDKLITVEVISVPQKSEDMEIQSQTAIPIQDSFENILKTIYQENEAVTEQSPEQKADDNNIPTFEEFIRYAKTLESYEPLLDFDIKTKYEFWVNNNWKNSSDRPITNWKSSLKSALPFMKNALQKTQLSMQSIPNIKRPKST